MPRTQTGPGGADFTVRHLRGGDKPYTCPGCLPLVHSIRTAKQKLRDAAPPKPAPEPAKA